MSAGATGHITIIVGSGRDLIRAAPLYRELRTREGMGVALVLTGQERDADLMSVYFRGLVLPQPDGLLEPGGGTRPEQTARVFSACETFLRYSPTDLVVLQGARDSILACAVVCKQRGLAVAQLEAGLRSRGRQLPEDVICEVLDHLCDRCFAPWPQAARALEAEGLASDRIVQAGDLMTETLEACRVEAGATRGWDDLGVDKEEFAVVALTGSRMLDIPTNLRKIVDAVGALTGDVPVVFPLSAQARRRLAMWHLEDELQPSEDLRLPDAKGFLDTYGLIGRALLLITDSGDLQEQASFLGVPCLTVAEATDRPMTVEQGTNTVVGPDTAAIISQCEAVLEGRGKLRAAPQPPLAGAGDEPVQRGAGDSERSETPQNGAAAVRTADALEEIAAAARREKRGSG